MARFGSLPVTIPDNVSVTLDDRVVKVEGPKGSIERRVPRGISIVQNDKELNVDKKKDTKNLRAQQGTMRAHLANMMHGVTNGWEKELEMVGAGYRAELRGKDLVLTIDYSHPVNVSAPEGIVFEVNKNNIKVSGVRKDVVGQTAAEIRAVRRPEPYKGKGIKYVDEVIRRKAGKQAAKAE